MLQGGVLPVVPVRTPVCECGRVLRGSVWSSVRSVWRLVLMRVSVCFMLPFVRVRGVRRGLVEG